MNKLTDDQLRILEREFWVETGVVEQGHLETVFDHIGFARAAIAASQEINSNVENPDKQRIRERLHEAGEESAKRVAPYLKELERQQNAMLFALSTLEGWVNYDDWIWPESALKQAKENTTEAIKVLRNALEVSPDAQPIPVSERPILKSNPFNDELGRCWCGTKEFVDKCGDTYVEYPASWEFREPSPQDDCLLPDNAIPQPEILK
jgi:hypothetical protein